jgi:hypothetical protein
MKESWLLSGDEKSKIRAMLLSQFKCTTAYTTELFLTTTNA